MNLLTRTTVAGLVVGVVLVSTSPAGVVYTKDGFPVHGKAHREMEVITDPATGQPIPIVKATNCYLMDDRARYVVIGPKQVESVDKDKDIRADHSVFQFPFGRPANRGRPSAAIIGTAGPFDLKGERKIAMTVFMPAIPQGGGFNLVAPPQPTQMIQQNVNARQKITHLSPYYMRLECLEYDWTANYLTNEFGPAIVLPLVRAHVEVAGKPGEAPEFEKRFRVVRFCTQAGWYAEATAEIMALRKQFGAVKDNTDKLDTADKALKQLINQRTWDEIDLAAKCGRHNKVLEMLAKVKLADMPAALQPEVSKVKTQYQKMADNMAQVRQAFAVCYDEFVGPSTELFVQTIPLIERELSFDTLNRLEPFAALGRQFDNDNKAGKPSQYGRTQVLAAAISGWVLGAAAAEPSEAAANKLWSVREQLLDLQRTAAMIDRSRKIADFISSCPLSIDEVARLITLLPPAEAEDFADPRYARPVDRQTSSAFTANPPFAYKLQLPPEYNPNRAYPLLVVLPNAGETTQNGINYWSADATRHGYILACVDWSGARGKYDYTAEEHWPALDCVRDLKRFVNVDCDRVFLAGSGEGANAAMDIGLSHPDVFAGVVPINGRPQWYSQQWYWRNAQNLPFYMVVGELSGQVRPWVSSMFEKWADKGYNSLMVMYRGRPTEFFTAEVPNIFDWLDRKHRPLAFPDLGRRPGDGYNGEEYQTYRATDNRFYWASTNHVQDKFVLTQFVGNKPNNPNPPQVANPFFPGGVPQPPVKQNHPNPAAIQASIRDGNQVTAFTRGVSQLSLWFGRVYDAQTGARDMIDFKKPLRVTLNNGRQSWSGNGKPLKPSMEVLLDDFCQRNDHRRLYFLRVDFDKVR